MKLAALDVGTNTVLMLIAQAQPGGEVIALADLSRITRLGRGVDRARRLDPQSSALTLDTIAEFVDAARAHGAQKILTAATSALRDAADGAAFIEQVLKRTGVALEIISGETEAELNYYAVRDLKLNPAHSLLIVDIGGGSTEFIAHQSGQPLRLSSLKIGSVRLTERLIAHDPPTADERRQVGELIAREIGALRWTGFAPQELIGVAGTVTTICSLAIGLINYDASLVHGHRLARTQVDEITQRLFAMTTEQRRRMPTMAGGRADVICAGAAILQEAMAAFAQDSVIVSDRGVRWGLIYRELARDPARAV